MEYGIYRSAPIANVVVVFVVLVVVVFVVVVAPLTGLLTLFLSLSLLPFELRLSGQANAERNPNNQIIFSHES